jgi:hypothetical protein
MNQVSRISLALTSIIHKVINQTEEIASILMIMDLKWKSFDDAEESTTNGTVWLKMVSRYVAELF